MTLEEIAKEIGVSKSTVSRALSGKQNRREDQKPDSRGGKTGRRAGGDGADPNGDAQHRRGTAFRRLLWKRCLFPELSARRLRIGIDARVQCADYDEQRA